MEIKESRFKVIANPNSKENKVIGYDAERKAYVVSVKARAEDNKANIMLINYLSKLLGKKVMIASGLKSREKIFEVQKQ